MNQVASAITVNGLTKVYGSPIGRRNVTALSDVSLDVRKGEIFGLLGPNGAGKTTLVKVLLGALHPTTGSATLSGFPISDWRSRLRAGFLPENHRFPHYLTGSQMLLVYGGMSGLSRSDLKVKAGSLLELVGLSEWRDTRIRKYSKGMMQRLGLAQALINDPEIILLDEPTDGVDPVGRHEIRNLLLDLKKRGKTIFLNSHLLAEVEAVCDRVAVLDRGKLLKIGPVQGLIDARPVYRVETVSLPPEIAEKIKMQHPDSVFSGASITVTLESQSAINGIIDLLRGEGVELTAVIPVRMSLEESFLQLIKGARDE